jgi:hypothetical protein
VQLFRWLIDTRQTVVVYRFAKLPLSPFLGGACACACQAPILPTLLGGITEPVIIGRKPGFYEQASGHYRTEKKSADSGGSQLPRRTGRSSSGLQLRRLYTTPLGQWS